MTSTTTTLTSSNIQTIREILYNLDPSDRIQFECYQDESPLEQSEKIFGLLKQEVGFIKVKQMLWKKLMNNSSITEDNVSDHIQVLIAESGCKELFETIIFKIFQSNYQQRLKPSLSLSPVSIRSKRSAEERVDHIQAVRQQWEQGLIEELAAIVTEAKRPFLMFRESGKINPFLSNNNANNEANNENIKFLYDSEDLMETLISMKNMNLKSDYHLRSIGLIKLSILPYDYNVILKKFSELTYSYSQLGVDDIHQNSTALLPPPTAAGNNPPLPPTAAGGASAAGFKFLQSRHDEAEWIMQRGSMPDAQLYLRRGCPPSIRSKIWRIACGFPPDKPAVYEEQLYSRLRFDCDRLDLITDELFLYDIQTVLDDPRFFVFEEELKEIVFCFSRDTTIREQILYEIHQPWLKQMGLDFSPDTSAPPSAVQPYLGFTTYFAPLCYLFKSKVMLYSVCKFLFCQIWCKLNVFSSDETTLIHLCKTFEGLLWSAQPKLFLHLMNINVHPVKVAFPWMQLGFVGLLEMDQLLHLWERIIGYMDPTLLAVTAVAIFIHRSEMLLRCANETDATMILMEGSRLHIISIIQAYLLKDGRNSN